MTSAEQGAATGYRLSWFRILKYIVYVLLMVNLFYYLWEDLIAFRYLPVGASLSQVLEAFAVTIDYVAWMVLILLFELETDAIPEEKLEGPLNWVLTGLAVACYVVLVYAFYGYVAGLVDYYKFAAFPPDEVCSLVEQNFGSVTMQDRAIQLTQENCGGFSQDLVFKHATDNLIAAPAPLAAGIKLAWIDVINAGVWLLLVLFMEWEVMLWFRDALSKRRGIIFNGIKGFLYLILLGNAIYWHVYGAFIDYWDAYLWLFAFVMIDLNIFQWDDTQQRKEEAPPGQA
jgi:hypothetical protein